MPLDNLTELRRRVPGGKYNLARAVAERARQLQSGESSPLVEVKSPNPLSVAIEEIVQGKISFTVTKEGEVGHSDYVAPEDELAAPDATDETIFQTPNEADDAIVSDGRVAEEERLTMETNAEATEPKPKARRKTKAVADAEAEAAEAQAMESEDEDEEAA